MKTLYRLFSAAAAFLLLAACTAAPSPAPLAPSATPTPSAPPSLAPTPTITPPPPTQTSQPTGTSPLDDLPTATLPTQRPNAITYYDGLPPGQYLVYYGEDQRFFAMTADQKQRILFAGNLDICYNSSDGRQIIVCDGEQRYLLDVQQGRLDPISLSGELSPDGRWAIHDCKSSQILESLAVQQTGQAEICLVQQPAQGALTDGFYVAFQGWSPDGKWLAYTKEMYKWHLSDPHVPADGLYLVDTTCLSAPETCAERTLGPFFISGLGMRNSRSPWFSPWSPDGRFVALYPAEADDNRLFFFNVETRSFRAFPITGGKAWVDRFAISADGATIAYIRPMYPDDACCSFLEPISGGPSTLFGMPEENLGPLFWLTVPSFKVGQALKISASGARLNLREQPSMSGKVITRLAQGTALTILEGPSGFGTYVWWKVRVEKTGLEGWVIEVPDWFER